MRRIVTILAMLFFAVGAQADDWTCVVENWAGVWTSEGTSGSSASQSKNPKIYLLREAKRQYTLFSDNENETLLDACNTNGTFCAASTGYAGIFTRDAEFNTFTLTYMAADPADANKEWVLTVTGKCSGLD